MPHFYPKNHPKNTLEWPDIDSEDIVRFWGDICIKK